MPEFVFSRKRDGSFQLESCESPDANLVIPSEHEGRPVTSIAEKTFEDCTGLRELLLPGSVRTIGERAFFNCSALETVELPPRLKFISRSAFAGCRSLVRITLPGRITRTMPLLSSQ